MTFIHNQTFRLLPDTEAQFLEGSDAFNTDMLPKLKELGLLGREVWRTDDGQYTILTRWTSPEALKTAMSGQTPPPFLAAIDRSSLTMQMHYVVSSA